MRTHYLWSSVLALCLVFVPIQAYPAQPHVLNAKVEAATPVAPYEQLHVYGADENSASVKEIVETFKDMVEASNQHSIENVLKHYNPQFISGDNMTMAQIKDLIQETWESYPDIRYDSKPVELRVSGDWATLETFDTSTATAPPDKDVINIPGKLKSESRSLLFLRKLGNTWEIMSDATIWEQAIIRYGVGDDIHITLSAPEQVKAGETYSATIQANIPEGIFTIATIDNQPLTFPHVKVDDKFRAMEADSNQLQRVLTANSTNHNEIVTATLGLTSVDQHNPDRPSLALNGIATIVKRVNVVPISSEDVLAALKRKDLVKTSANGKIDLTGNLQPPATKGADLELSVPASPVPTQTPGRVMPDHGKPKS